jgi:aryl-alcohol dehydrogenase-like predicted oxidoreductase
MRYRLLGNSGLRVSEVILGAMTFGDADGVGAAPAECRRMVDLYADAGGNVIDTAINYRGGASESIVGELLTGRRDRFVLSTKYTVSRDTSDPNAAGNHRKNLLISLETSLRRLRTDYVDLYWVHIWDRLTPVEETIQALDDAVRSGKVLYVGISDTPAWVIARADTLAQWRGWARIDAIQVPYSLVKRDIERELLPMAEAARMSVATWSPLAGGVLSGKYAEPSNGSARRRLTSDSVTDRERRVAGAVRDVAHELGFTPAQVALAWVMSRSTIIHPILGARTAGQLSENLGAVQCRLPEACVQRLDAASQFDIGFPTDFLRDTSGWVLGTFDVEARSR